MRTGLGDGSSCLNPPEMDELIRRVAQVAGFFPIPEFGFWYESNFRIDWVWIFPPGHARQYKLAAAFERDGTDIDGHSGAETPIPEEQS
jgi:hypothetical protein